MPTDSKVRRSAQSVGASASATKNGGRKAATKEPPKPRGRDEVVEAIIDATLSLWVAEGPASLSLRSIAARAGVNYGLVYRHFRTKDALIRVAMDRAAERSYAVIENKPDLVSALSAILSAEVGGLARLFAWAILQSESEVLLLSAYPVFGRLCELAAKETVGLSADSLEIRMRVGSLMVMMMGWQLFQPHLRQGLKLSMKKPELDRLIRNEVLALVRDGDVKGDRLGGLKRSTQRLGK
jgi:AcrR family transcriptional regulator